MFSIFCIREITFVNTKKGKRKVQGVPQSQTAALPTFKRKRKPTNLNKHKPNKRTKSTKISSLFPKRGNRNTKRTEKHKNKMTHGKTYNKLKGKNMFSEFANQGPVVQSIVSLTSSLEVKMLTVLVSMISDSQIFLLKKM